METDTAGRFVYRPGAFCGICGGSINTAGECVSTSEWSRMVHQREHDRSEPAPTPQTGEGA